MIEQFSSAYIFLKNSVSFDDLTQWAVTGKRCYFIIPLGELIEIFGEFLCYVAFKTKLDKIAHIPKLQSSTLLGCQSW